MFSCIKTTYCEENKLGLGLGWPYFGLKYNFSKRINSEFRWATGEGINVYAGRVYWNFYCDEKMKGFTGLEGGYIGFDTLEMEGNGYEGSVFLGGEYYLTKRLSLELDLSPAFIGLKSDDYRVSGVEFIANISIYYYFLGN